MINLALLKESTQLLKTGAHPGIDTFRDPTHHQVHQLFTQITLGQDIQRCNLLLQQFLDTLADQHNITIIVKDMAA